MHSGVALPSSDRPTGKNQRALTVTIREKLIHLDFITGGGQFAKFLAGRQLAAVRLQFRFQNVVTVAQGAHADGHIHVVFVRPESGWRAPFPAAS